MGWMFEDGLKTSRRAVVYQTNMKISLRSFGGSMNDLHTIWVWRAVSKCFSFDLCLAEHVCSCESHNQPHKVDCIAATAVVVSVATTKTTTTDSGTNNSNSLYDFIPVVWTSWLATFYLYHSLFTCTSTCIGPILSCTLTRVSLAYAPCSNKISNISPIA